MLQYVQIVSRSKEWNGPSAHPCLLKFLWKVIMTTRMTSYPVRFSNEQLASIIGRIEESTAGADRDLLIVSLITMAVCISDPALIDNDIRFHNVLDSVSTHICWVLQDGGGLPMDPKLMN